MAVFTDLYISICTKKEKNGQRLNMILTLRKHDILASRAGPSIDLVAVALPCLRRLGLPLPLQIVAFVGSYLLLLLAYSVAECGNALAESLVPAADVGAALLLRLDVVRLFLGCGEESGLLGCERRCGRRDGRRDVRRGVGLGV
jgi:hypothetical protein